MRLKTLKNVLYWTVNIAGLLAALPLLYLSGFAFDRPGKLALAWATLAVNLIYPILSVKGILARDKRHLGLLGLGITVGIWFATAVTCSSTTLCD